MLRFHLHPLVAVHEGGSDGEVVLIPSGGGRWSFLSAGAPIAVEDSVHFANPDGPRRSLQIVITVQPSEVAEGDKGVAWHLEPMP